MWSRDMVALISADSSPVHAVAYAPDGHTVAFGGLDQMVQVWDVTADNPKRKAVLQGHTGVVRLVLFPPDRKTLASVCDGGRIILWDLESAAKLRDWQLPRLTICSVAFTYDARYLAAGVSDGSVHVFRLYPKADEAAG
jgi:WD40 repeat protein